MLCVPTWCRRVIRLKLYLDLSDKKRETIENIAAHQSQLDFINKNYIYSFLQSNKLSELSENSDDATEFLVTRQAE